ncbi:ABC transporter ATP-binding protein [Ureaplasma parvum]|uniref:Transport ATP-binding protein n=2 Tax=Ureaplasma parvum serovar 3 TaxID=38504 RepID=Q9PR85_UREPA|nr:ABC transporter ATP-binding protein [Ureaplasma parvum]pir/F82939/ transport ATP-binding protein UU060 [imported] - Ureaplasma urealyticum [Ureaplasma urealyticum]AAF30465.1 transport ATP-binding protein [Ureaplasma parvum serovar 3 str. ATCC 700970]ACA33099.1 transport ATP-binding protein [Ureaplasma parvum serovar 3 str. ATCC 27815]EDT87951.1 transport ATP-binding protein [Ureaplasma parvum serovar 14 str. ATCC 33697]
MSQQLQTNKPVSKLYLIYYYFKDFKKVFIGLSIAIIFWLSTTIAATFLLQETVDKYAIANGIVDTVVKMCAGLIGIYFFSFIFLLIINEFAIRISFKIESHLSMMVINRIRYLPMKYFDINKSGEIFTKTLSDPTSVQDGIVNFYIELNKAIFGAIGFGTALLITSPYIALIGIVIYVLVMLFNILIFKKSHQLMRIKRQNFGEMNGYIEEMIYGQNVVANFNEQVFFIKKLDNMIKKLYKNWIKAQYSSQIIFPWSIFSMRLMNAVLIVSYLLISIKGIHLPGLINNIDPTTNIISFGGLVSISLFGNFFCDNFSQLSNTIPIFIVARTSLAKIDEIVKTPNEINWNEKLIIDASQGIEVRFENVNFNYLKNTPTLKNINFVAKRNQRIAIIGPTGAGKTTITNLINKFYDINNGFIYFNDVDITNKSRESVREHISIVLQDPFLFSESIYENIKKGKMNATKEEIIAAAKKAQVHDLILSFPKDYATVIDEKQNLSQGQKQLITIARAIISDAKIIILDEATSSVDTQTEHKLQLAINNLLKGRTSFIIAHRLSTIINSDLILVIKDGEIIAQGNHDYLIKNSPFYQELYYANFNE